MNLCQGTLYGHLKDADAADLLLEKLRVRLSSLCGGRSFEMPLEEHEILFCPMYNQESSMYTP